jgi:hypothetical protein
MAKQEIKVKVEYTPGYEKRYTEAVLKRLSRRPQGRSATDLAKASAQGERK